ncbi:MAG: hypothetical protein IKL65_04985 [Bacilli bacterium]|nr:hypothetical protein [Bacilli bacterium]
MTKISEQIKYYEHLTLKSKDKIDSYFEDPYIYRKIEDLKLMQDAIGDVELTDDYIKVFLYELFDVGFKPDYDKIIEKIKIIYELSKDTELTREELITLFTFYQHGVYSLMFDEIKKIILSHKDLKSSLEIIISEALKYGKEEAEKLDYLKKEYSSEFIEYIKRIVQEELISSDKVIEIIPSKDFIKSSIIKIPLGYDIVSAEDLVAKRLKSKKFDEDYLTTLADKKIALGLCSTGEMVYTSFKKSEYEEDLKYKKRLIRKK